MRFDIVVSFDYNAQCNYKMTIAMVGKECIMKTIILNEKQEMILRDLLMTEIEYLENEAIPDASDSDKLELKNELIYVKEMYEKVTNND